MGTQQMVKIDTQMIMMLQANPKNKWRNCQRKSYDVFAIQPEADYVFANKLEQPLSYKMLMSKFKKAVVHKSEFDAETANYVKQNGCYITNGEKVVLCGTRGELWDVKPEKFVKSYTNTDGSAITKMPKEWIMVSRASESQPSAKGIQIPKQYLAEYATSWGDVLKMNDPNSSGHYSGDILVVSNSGDISPINNEVFAMTFNLSVGGWGQSGLITPEDKIKKATVEDVKKLYNFSGGGSKKPSEGFNYIAVKEYIESKGITLMNDLTHLFRTSDDKTRAKLQTAGVYFEWDAYSAFCIYANGICFSVEKRNVANPYGDIVTEKDFQKCTKELLDSYIKRALNRKNR